jgi:hypothetical protein
MERGWKRYDDPSGSEIARMKRSHLPELNGDGPSDALRKDSHPILSTFALPHGHDALRDVDVLHAKCQTLADAEAGSVQHGRDEARGAAHLSEHGKDFCTREYLRHAVWPLGADDFIAHGEGDAKYVEVEKLKGGERLVLSRGSDVSAYREGGEKCTDLALAHSPGVTSLVERDEPADPPDICILSGGTQMTGANARANCFDQSHVEMETRGTTGATSPTCRRYRTVPRREHQAGGALRTDGTVY